MSRILTRFTRLTIHAAAGVHFENERRVGAFLQPMLQFRRSVAGRLARQRQSGARQLSAGRAAALAVFQCLEKRRQKFPMSGKSPNESDAAQEYFF
jgi:hypothetical protein